MLSPDALPAEPVSSAPPPGYSAFSIAACLIGTFALRSVASIVGSTLQLYFGYIDQNVYALSDSARGLALAVFFLPELFGSPILGAWSDRFGSKPFLLIGAVSGGIGVLLAGLTSNYAALAAMRFLGGLSTASAVPATLGYLSSMTMHSPSLRGRVMGLFQMATLAGTIIGIVAGGKLWDVWHTGAFMLDAGFYFLTLVIFAIGVYGPWLVRPSQVADSEAQGDVERVHRRLSRYLTLFRSADVLRFAPAFISINIVLGIWMNHVISQLVSTDRAFPGQMLYGILGGNVNAGTDISLYGTLILAVFGLGAMVWSFMIGRFRRTALMIFNIFGLYLLCATIFVLNHSSDPHSIAVPVFVGLILLETLVISGMLPAALTYLADITEEHSHDRGAIMGLYTIFFGLGGFTGTLVGGPFADWAAVDGLVAATLIFGSVALVLLVRLHLAQVHKDRKRSAILSKE